VAIGERRRVFVARDYGALTDAEQQIATLRKELDAEYEAKLTPSGRSSHPRFSSKICALTATPFAM